MAKQTIDDLAVIVSADTRGLAASLKQAERDLKEFRKHVEQATGNKPPPVTQWARSTGAEFRGMAAAARSAAAEVMGFTAKLAITGGTLIALEAGISGASEVFNQFKESIDLAKELELTTLAFEVMLKSADRAREMLGDIRRFAATTPFNSRELTDAARKLIAYGIAADQVMPTLRMLGDVSAATQTPISDLAYLYGTLNAQQRAYSRDIYQFSNRGIPIYEELARVLGKSVSETRDLVEEGKVGFPEVVRAFKAMTEGEGRYAGLTRRQAESFAGQWEAAQDAFRLAKLKFGQIVIEEFGLKEAARDFDGFMKRVEAGMDSIRPGVRLVGDLFKGLVQTGHEFGRVIAVAVENGGGAFGRAFPQMAQAAKEFRQMIADAQNFKLDDEQVLQFAASLTKALASGFINTTKYLAQVGLTFKDAFVDPLLRSLKFADETIQAIIRRLDEFNKHLPEKDKFILGALPAWIWKEAELMEEERKKAAQAAAPGPQGPLAMRVPPEFMPPSPLENDEAVIARARALYAEQGKAAGRLQRGAGSAADVQFWKEVEDRFLSQFVENPDAARHMLVIQGQMPTYKPDAIKRLTGGELVGPVAVARPGGVAPPPQPAQDPFIAALKELASADPAKAMGKIDEFYAPLIADARKRKLDEEAAAKEARDKELAGMAALGGSFGELRDAAGKAKEALVAIPNQIPAEWRDAAKKAKEEFADPLNKLKEESEALFN
ncbi:MAG TPA: tape measure protein, partial [Gemmataceae bacterium]|nr:tape measure protein [Gemmataceae bacterium]